jgi:hypothetical protein
MFQRLTKRSIRAALSEMDRQMDASTGCVGEVDLSTQPELYDGALELLERARRKGTEKRAGVFVGHPLLQTAVWASVAGVLLVGALMYKNGQNELAHRTQLVDLRQFVDSSMRSSHRDQLALRMNDSAIDVSGMVGPVRIEGWEQETAPYLSNSLVTGSRERAKAPSDVDVIRQSAALAICLLGRVPGSGLAEQAMDNPMEAAGFVNLRGALSGDVNDMASVLNSIHAVPEPGTFGLIAIALVGLAGSALARRRLHAR